MLNFKNNEDKRETKKEGKKLKKRGAKLEGSYFDAQHLEIEKDGPAPALLQEGGEIEEGQEYFTDRDLGKENEKDRAERLKKEMEVARRQQLELQKQLQQQLKTGQRINDPNLKLDEIEQGLMQSQNKGKPVNEGKFKQHDPHAQQHEHEHEHGDKHQHLHKTDAPAAGFLLGKDNIKNLDLSHDKQLAEKGKGSIPATQVQDIRSKSDIERSI